MTASYDQQPSEPAQWYDRFTRYRLLGPMRSIRKTYQQELEDDCLATTGKIVKLSEIRVPTPWYDISKEWHWKARAEEWDAENRQKLIEEDRVEREAFRHRFLKRQRGLVDALTEKVEQMLQFPVAEVTTKIVDDGGHTIEIKTIKPADWRLRDIAAMTDTLTKIGRLSAGESTENVKQIGVNLEDVLDALPAELGEKVREELERAVSTSGDRPATEE